MTNDERELLLFNVRRAEEAVKAFIKAAPDFSAGGKMARECGTAFACLIEAARTVK